MNNSIQTQENNDVAPYEYNTNYENDYDSFQENQEDTNENLRNNINDYYENMGYQKKEKKKSKFSPFVIIFAVILCLIGYNVGLLFRQNVPSNIPSNNNDNPSVIFPVHVDKGRKFYDKDSYTVSEDRLAPEDFFLYENGETEGFSYDSDGNMFINKNYEYEYVYSRSDNFDDFSTSKDMKIADDINLFFEKYGNYRADSILVFNSSEENITLYDITVSKFKEKYIDSGILNLSDPTLTIEFRFSIYSDGERILNDGEYTNDTHTLTFSMTFDSTDALGNNTDSSNNTSTGMHLDSFGGSYYEY